MSGHIADRGLFSKLIEISFIWNSVPELANEQIYHESETRQPRIYESTIDATVTVELPQRIIGDRAVDSGPLDAKLAADRIELIAPHRRGRVRPPTQDARALRRYKRWWKTERLFA
jgi:hypothetical protein